MAAVVGTRHILSHEYDRLLPEKLWHVLRDHLPTMLRALEANIDKLPAAGGPQAHPAV